MSETANWAYPQIDRAPGELDDNYLKRLLAQSTFYVWVEKSDFPMKVWWKQSKCGRSCSSWKTVPEGILNSTRGILDPIESDHLHDSTVQMAGVIALFGDQTPDWMKLSENDKELRQRTVNPNTLDDYVAIAIRNYAMNQGIPVEEAQALIKRGLERDSGLASFLVTSFVDQAIESGKSEERSDDDSNVGSTCTKSATESVVTFRTA